MRVTAPLGVASGWFTLAGATFGVVVTALVQWRQRRYSDETRWADQRRQVYVTFIQELDAFRDLVDRLRDDPTFDEDWGEVHHEGLRPARRALIEVRLLATRPVWEAATTYLATAIHYPREAGLASPILVTNTYEESSWGFITAVQRELRIS
jgi:hypothetical protein